MYEVRIARPISWVDVFVQPCVHTYIFWSSASICQCRVRHSTSNDIPAWKINIIISIKPITISWNYRYGTIIFLNLFLPPHLFISFILGTVFFHYIFSVSVSSSVRWCSNFHWTRSYQHLPSIHESRARTRPIDNDHRGKFPNWKFNRRVAAT